MAKIKKIILLALTVLVMVGCWNDGDIVNHRVSFVSVVYDSCEYIISNLNDRTAHKGNCRFCKERRQKELEELVIKLKEK